MRSNVANNADQSLDEVELLMPAGIEESWKSCDGGGSNAIILPGKKKNKLKVKSNAKKKEIQTLSKSKQRKLRQLEEERQKKLLQEKSIKILEEHKIWDGAYSLLHSSGTIGRAETFKERRFRAVQISKAGLEVPEDILPFKEKHHPNVFNDDEAALEVDPIQSLRNDVGVDITLPEKCMKIDDNNHNLSIDVPLPSPKVRETNMSASAIADQKCSSTTASYDGYDILAQDNMLGYSDKKYQEIEGITDLTVQEHVNATTVVHISRPREVEEHRKDLPIIMMEQEIMEAINEHFIVILCGETGCGKTTQVPQFLYEAGFGSSLRSDRKGIIGVTQPRRVAVLATAKRVSFELGLGLGKEVGFQVRHDKLIGKSCSIKFMTDGILLREVQVLE